MYEDNRIFANCCERVGERNVTPSIKEDFPHLCGKTKKSTNAILRWLKFLPRVQGGTLAKTRRRFVVETPSPGAGGNFPVRCFQRIPADSFPGCRGELLKAVFLLSTCIYRVGNFPILKGPLWVVLFYFPVARYGLYSILQWRRLWKLLFMVGTVFCRTQFWVLTHPIESLTPGCLCRSPGKSAKTTVLNSTP